jgi:7-carboxy-7-deazaguanine synthase (Cx14CxxC type)
MSYKVKEVYLTIQGEGYQTGRVAVFCRFTGCNLWSGYEKDRKRAICDFCDTDFVGTDGPGGGVFEDAKSLTQHLLSFWDSDETPFFVFTGGEPLLQMDDELVFELKHNKIEIAIETNGTIFPPDGIDWVCVSPKANTELIVHSGEECKVVYPQKDLDLNEILKMDFKHFSLQPMDGEQIKNNTLLTMEYCRKNPKWSLSIQTHKYLNIP